MKMKKKNSANKKSFPVRTVVMALLCLLPVLHVWVDSCISGSMPDLDWKRIFGNEEWNATDFLVTQLSLTFIVSSIITMLSSKDEKLLWCNLIQKNLVEPVGRSLKDFVYYLFTLLILNFFCVMLDFKAGFLLYFSLCILCLIWISVKMLRVYFDREGTVKKLKKRFLKASEKDKADKLSALFDNSVAAINISDSAALMENICFLLSLKSGDGILTYSAQDTLVGIFQVIADKDTVLFYRMYKQTENYVLDNGIINSDEKDFFTELLDENFSDGFYGILEKVWEDSVEKNMTYLSKNLPRCQSLKNILSYNFATQSSIIVNELEELSKSMKKVFVTLCDMLDGDPEFICNLTFQRLERDEWTENATLEKNMYITHASYRVKARETIDMLFENAGGSECIKKFRTVIDDFFEKTKRVEILYDTIFFGESSEENMNMFISYYDLILDKNMNIFKEYYRYGEGLAEKALSKQVNSNLDVAEYWENFCLFFWIINNAVKSSSCVSIVNQTYENRRKGYNRINGGKMIRLQESPEISSDLSHRFSFIEKNLPLGMTCYGGEPKMSFTQE